MVDIVTMPNRMARNFIGGPKFSTTVIPLSGGRSHRNSNWPHPQHTYDFAYGPKKRSELEEIQAFFYGRRGCWRTFLMRDWADYFLDAADVSGGVGTKTYDSVYPYERELQWLEGSPYILSLPGHSLHGMSVQNFLVPVAFTVDHLQVTMLSADFGQIDSLGAEEVR